MTPLERDQVEMEQTDNARLRKAIEDAVQVTFPKNQRDYVNRVLNPLRKALEEEILK